MSESPDLPPLGSESGLGRWTGAACDAAGWMLVAMVVLVCAEIAARTLLGSSTLIADEYSGYLFVWITLIGFAHALQLGTFLRVEQVVYVCHHARAPQPTSQPRRSLSRAG